MQPIQQRHDPGVGGGLDQIVPVVILLIDGEDFLQPLALRPGRERNEPLCPVADEAAHLPEAAVRQLESIHRSVERVSHVLERVQQRAVEIK